MNIILLSGGSGQSLWPLSNDARSKQFLKLFTGENGIRESMTQRMYRMIKSVDSEAKVTIAASEKQLPLIKEQLGDDVDISIEPSRKGTFPAIILAAAHLKEKGVGPDDTIIACPVDTYVDEDYYVCLKQINNVAYKANLTIMGIKPTHISDQYGYIIPETDSSVSVVKKFIEKPSVEIAEECIKQGALWNAGVFAFKLSYLLDIAISCFGTDDYTTIYNAFAKLEPNSFDCVVIEKEKEINVVPFSGCWIDIESWNALSKIMTVEESGNVSVENCDNTHIVNELGLPLIALGVSNSIIAATPDGILVSDKAFSSNVKKYIDSDRPMYEHRKWGEYKVLDFQTNSENQNSLVKELIIEQGQHISYQKHNHRTEIWIFTQGSGVLIQDDGIKHVGRGDVAIIPIGMKHAIIGETELHIIEVQLGDELIEEDIERLEWDWNKR